MLLDKGFAARIQNTLESIQPYPVVIFNRLGVAIATHAKHPGLSQRRIVQKLDAWPDAPQQDLDSVRCITYKGAAVGALELVGLRPEDAPYLAMAETVVELMLEKEAAFSAEGGAEPPLQGLLTSLVGVHPADTAQLQRDLVRNGVNLATPRTTILFQLSRIEKKRFNTEVRRPIVDSRQFAYAIEEFYEQLPLYFSNKDDFIVLNQEKQSALVLCADRSTTLDVNTVSIFNICKKLEQLVQRGQLFELYAVIGNRCCRIEDYERQYEQMEIRLSAGQLLRSDQHIILGSSVVLGSMVLYDGLDTRKRITTFVFGGLLASRQRKTLLDTLHAYFDCNMNATLTAKRLFIHRNTLQQRLHRIAELTGYSADTADGLLTLRLGLLYYSSLLYDGALSDILPEAPTEP